MIKVVSGESPALRPLSASLWLWWEHKCSSGVSGRVRTVVRTELHGCRACRDAERARRRKTWWQRQKTSAATLHLTHLSLTVWPIISSVTLILSFLRPPLLPPSFLPSIVTNCTLSRYYIWDAAIQRNTRHPQQRDFILISAQWHKNTFNVPADV